jgi:DNA-directed RNA polymerase specialized sigma24 family protein
VISATTDGSGAPLSLETLIRDCSVPLRRSLVARFGVEVGVEAHADAIAYAVEHSQRLLSMQNPLGYLFRVGQSSARRMHRWGRTLRLTAEPFVTDDVVSPELLPALEALPARQRVAVLLVHGYSFSYAEVASILQTPESSVRNYVHRGLVSLRRAIGEEGSS